MTTERTASSQVPTTSRAEAVTARERLLSDFRARYLVPTLSFAAVVALILLGGLTTPGFLSTGNLLVTVRVASLTGIMALGMTFITISGSFFSLSVAQTGAFVSIAFAAMVEWGWGWPLALTFGLVVGAILGGAQGAVVALGANPIVVTLAGGGAIFGLAAILTQSRAVIISDNTASWIGTSRPLGIPIQTYTFLVLTVIAQLILVRTRFGRRAILAGANRHAARATGVPLGQVAITTFAASGLAAGLAGIFVAAQSNRGLVTNLQDANFDVVAAVLVGGTAIQGGEGSMIRTTFGAALIVLIDSLLVLRGYSAGVRRIIGGVAIVVAVSAFWFARGGRSR
jgi:simple sugar transport system permease protein/ribose transport system permease protein